MRRFKTLTGLAGATTLLLWGSLVTAQPSGSLLHTGSCAVVEVPGVLVLPDGTTHEVGSLRICLVRWLSPVAAIHVLYLGRTPWGMLLSRVGKDPDVEGADPLVVFARDTTGHVRLTGYAWPDRHSMLTMAFGQPGSKADATRLLKDCEQSDELILIAARRD